MLTDSQNALRQVQLMVVWKLGNVLSTSQCFYYSCCAGHFHTRARCSAAAPVQAHTAILPRSKFSVVFLLLVLQDGMRAVL